MKTLKVGRFRPLLFFAIVRERFLAELQQIERTIEGVDRLPVNALWFNYRAKNRVHPE